MCVPEHGLVHRAIEGRMEEDWGGSKRGQNGGRLEVLGPTTPDAGIVAHLSKTFVATTPQHVSHWDQPQDHAQPRPEKRHPSTQHLLKKNAVHPCKRRAQAPPVRGLLKLRQVKFRRRSCPNRGATPELSVPLFLLFPCNQARRRSFFSRSHSR